MIREIFVLELVSTSLQLLIYIIGALYSAWALRTFENLKLSRIFPCAKIIYAILESRHSGISDTLARSWLIRKCKGKIKTKREAICF